MTFLDWAGIASAIILVCVGIVLAFQLGYAKGRMAAQKEMEGNRGESLIPWARIIRPPERPS